MSSTSINAQLAQRRPRPFVRVPVTPPPSPPAAGSGLVAHSKAMQEMMALIDAVAPSNCAILITGETGTGKERVARALHARSHRVQKRLLAMQCAAIPPTLLERELFGHERGAFTGADASKRGAFEAAEGGTFLLDEIGELEPTLQVKLLRVLQEKEIVRLGSPDPIPINVRILAATNRDLRQEVERGAFRSDLFFRLNTVELRVPSLRERREDIIHIAREALDEGREAGAPPCKLSPATANYLLDYDWPGNVRELLSVIERACLLCAGKQIEPEHLPPEVLQRGVSVPVPVAAPRTLVPAPAVAAEPLPPTLPDFREARREFERQYFLQALVLTRGNISAAARNAGLSWKHFRHKMTELHIHADSWATIAAPAQAAAPAIGW